MRETPDELAALQALIDASFAVAGGHFADIAGPGRRLSAAQVVALLQGMKHIALATTARDGSPFIGPLDAFFVHGRFWATTSASAQRVRHIKNNPRVSVVQYAGDDYAITVHGTATLFRKGAPEIEDAHAVMTDFYKGSPFNWGDIVVIRIDPAKMLTYAQHPEKFG